MQIIKATCLIILMFICNNIIAQSSPIPMIEDASNNLLNTLKENKANLKNNPKIIREAVHKYLVPIVDVNGMSRSVIGRDSWKNASVLEKKEFSDAFLQLVIRTYSSPLADYSGETIKFLPVRGGNDKFVKVNSIVMRPNGQKIPVTYSLVANNGQWKVYDFSVEGISLLQSFKSQFSQVLKNSTMKDLIRQMQKKQVG